MKLSLLTLCICLLFSRCVSLGDPLPGLYVSSSSNEFATVADSLSIARSPNDNEYIITRGTYIDYFRKEERQPQYRTDRWTALYDHKTKSMSIRDNGRILYLNEEKDGLLLGKTLYKKVEHEKMDRRVVLAH